MEALDIFRIVAPEFKNISDDDEYDETTGDVKQYGVKTYLNLYADLISKKRFGSLYNKALAYLTAHKMKMGGLGDEGYAGKIGDSLRVSSVSEGETSVSFSTGQSINLQTDAEYALTVYGIEFLNLRRLAVVPIISSGEADAYVCEDS